MGDRVPTDVSKTAWTKETRLRDFVFNEQCFITYETANLSINIFCKKKIHFNALKYRPTIKWVQSKTYLVEMRKKPHRFASEKCQLWYTGQNIVLNKCSQAIYYLTVNPPNCTKIIKRNVQSLSKTYSVKWKSLPDIRKFQKYHPHQNRYVNKCSQN